MTTGQDTRRDVHRTTGPVVGRVRAVAPVLVAVLALAPPASARVVIDDDAVPAAAQGVLERIADAFQASDHHALGDLVHPDGVRLGLGPEADRISELTPAQAYYYFKALFRSGRTEQFEYLRERSARGDRVLAMATWRRVPAEHGGVEMRRVLVTIARHTGGWRITGMTALSGG